MVGYGLRVETEFVIFDAFSAYNYAVHKNCKLDLEYERLISVDAYYSFVYARDILKKRFKLGEDSISKRSFESCHYAINVLKSRFGLGEPSIAKDQTLACYYAFNIFDNYIPLDFLELCQTSTLNAILNNSKIENKNDVIKILFKKKLLGQ